MLKATLCCTLVIAFFFTPKVSLAFSESPQMISSFEAMSLEEMSFEDMSLEERADKQKQIETFITKDSVQKMLEERGLDPATAAKRLAVLNDRELKQLAESIEKEKAGALLVEIVLILLIIYLARRI